MRFTLHMNELQHASIEVLPKEEAPATDVGKFRQASCTASKATLKAFIMVRAGVCRAQT